jgi:hypothetical protein
MERDANVAKEEESLVGVTEDTTRKMSTIPTEIGI